jgi:hypothetical protein
MATVTALHGRTRALVQRPRRRMHVASISAGDTNWVTICDRDVLADGAKFWVHDADTIIDDHADELCATCYRLVLFATVLVAGGIIVPKVRVTA